MPKLRLVSYKQLVKVFEAAGFVCVRIEGDHMVMTKPGVIRPSEVRRGADFHHQEQSANRGDVAGAVP